MTSNLKPLNIRTGSRKVGSDFYEPFFSVIMACHNAEEYIEEAVQSVLNQTCADWELIIVDDASTDKSYKIASKYNAIDQRIKVYRLDTNRGAGFTRNYAVERSSGRWLAILDADDLFLPDKLERQRNFITAYHDGDLVLVGTDVIHISSEGQFLKAYSYPKESNRIKRNLYAMAKFPPHSSIIYKASVFNEVGGFNHRFLRSQDYELWLRISEKGEIASLEVPLIKYRLHIGGVSVNPTSHGYTQYMYAVAANICWRLRVAGCGDPSQDDQSFACLMQLISSLYMDSAFEKSHMLLLRLKAVMQRREWFYFLKICIQKPLTLSHLIFERIGIVSFNNITLKKYKSSVRCAE